MEQKMCEYCGKNPAVGRSKYCSESCKQKAKRAKIKGIVPYEAVHEIVLPEEDSLHLAKTTFDSLAANDETFEEPPIEEVESTEGYEEDTSDDNPFTKNRDPDYDVEANLAAFKKMGLDQVEWLTTGIPEFDELTRIPKGRVTQIQGPYAVGKTTLCLNMLVGLNASKAVKKILYIDSEASLNPTQLTKLKLDHSKVELYNASAFIEDIYNVILEAVKTPKYDAIILDSLAATTFRVEAANEAADSNIGQKAKIVGKLMRIVPMELKRTKTALIIINQERVTIGGYGPISYTPGGSGVLYAASLMISLRSNKSMRITKDGKFIGQKVQAEIIKSKVNDPWRKATFKIYYGT